MNGPVKGQLLGHTVTTRAVQATSARAIGAEVAGVLKPLNKGDRFVSEALLAAWPEIVGDRLAGLCLPTRLKAAPRGRSKKAEEAGGAILEVLADHAVAIDLDYGQALLVERINAFYGYRAVGALKVVRRQRSMDGRQAIAAAPAPKPPSRADRAQAAKRMAGIEAPSLRKALEDLCAALECEARRR